MSSIKVAVRVRPFNPNEIKNKSKCIIRMEGSNTCKNFFYHKVKAKKLFMFYSNVIPIRL
jgi:hypothetical protein